MPATDNERAVIATLAARHGLLDENEALEVLDRGIPGNQSVLQWLLARATVDKLLRAVADELGVTFVDFHATDVPYEIDQTLLERCDIRVLRSLSFIPLRVIGSEQIVIAAANPSNPTTRDYSRSRFPEGFTVALATKKDIDAKLVFFESMDRETPVEDDLPAAATTAIEEPKSPAVRWVDQVLERAALEGVSDVHFFFDIAGRLKLRFRSDGMLRELPMPLTAREQGEVIPSLMARCSTVDSSNLRLPADGTFSFSAAGRRLDVRMAMLPQNNGPTMVLRLLDPQNVQRSLESMGFDPEHLRVMREATAQSQGMVMVCGPTGSGKSTTLYSLLNEVDAEARHVMTVEDPVEYRLPYINQTQIKDGLGERSLTFAKALRSILRLDPDVILVGECRDDVTARIAMDAAITGHMVLSTVHANDAIQVFTRLIEMGVPPYLVAEAMSVAVSQRLIRRIHSCATSRPANEKERLDLARLGIDIETVPVPVGCGGCNGTGYLGRIAVLGPPTRGVGAYRQGAVQDAGPRLADPQVDAVPLGVDARRRPAGRRAVLRGARPRLARR